MTATTIDRPTLSATPINPAADWIDQYALDRVEYQVFRIGRNFRLSSHDEDEVRQELLMDLWVAAPKFNPEIASRRTFVSGVVARSALRVRRQLSRSPGRRAAEPVVLSDLQRRERDRRTPERTQSEQSDIALDVASAIDGLEQGKRALAHELMRGTVTEAARELGYDRSTAYRAVAAMRTELVDLKSLMTA